MKLIFLILSFLQISQFALSQSRIELFRNDKQNSYSAAKAIDSIISKRYSINDSIFIFRESYFKDRFNVIIKKGNGYFEMYKIVNNFLSDTLLFVTKFKPKSFYLPPNILLFDSALSKLDSFIEGPNYHGGYQCDEGNYYLYVEYNGHSRSKSIECIFFQDFVNYYNLQQYLFCQDIRQFPSPKNKNKNKVYRKKKLKKGGLQPSATYQCFRK